MTYSWTKIASQLNISRSTLFRRLRENNVSSNDYTSPSNATLDSIIHSIKCDTLMMVRYCCKVIYVGLE